MMPGQMNQQPSPSKPLPLDLPRQVMRRAGLVALLTLLLAALLGLQRAGSNIDDEVDAALALAEVVARLGRLAQADDARLLAELRAQQDAAPLRHLALHIHAADGRRLLGPPAPPPAGAALGWFYALHRELLSAPERRQVSWLLPRPQGEPWTVALAASPESERREALSDLAGMLLLLLGSIAGLLLVMRWNVTRAFAPLSALLGAIDAIEQRAPDAVQHLPRMPIRELEVIAAALRRLAADLDRAEAQRRLLSQKVLTLQEDERNFLARELHDEFGQRLTALRVDLSWLGRQLADRPELLTLVQAMAARCGAVQRDIRELLVRLDPLGPRGADTTEAQDALTLGQLLQLLHSLVQSWQGPPEPAGAEPPGRTEFRLETGRQPGSAAAAGHAATPLALQALQAADEALLLPRALALVIYRLSQEALTNAARHAQARHVLLRLTLEPGQALCWQVSDDGIGIADPARALQQGNGLGGMQERVWALGGAWHWQTTGPGLTLQARLPWPARQPEQDPAPDRAPDPATPRATRRRHDT